VLRADRGSNIPDRMIAKAARAENVAADTPGGDLNELPVPVPHDLSGRPPGSVACREHQAAGPD
jgi:hypothetical protein